MTEMLTIATLTERHSDRHGTFYVGRLGETNIRLQPMDTPDNDGRPQWRLVVMGLRPPQTPQAARNQRGAKWRIQQRREERVESLGGRD